MLDEKGNPFKVVSSRPTWLTEAETAQRRFRRPDRRDRQVAGGDRVQPWTAPSSTANENFLNALGYSLARDPGPASQHVRRACRNATAPAYREFWADAERAAEYQAGEFKRIGKAGRGDLDSGILQSDLSDLNGKPFKVVKYAMRHHRAGDCPR